MCGFRGQCACASVGGERDKAGKLTIVCTGLPAFPTGQHIQDTRQREVAEQKLITKFRTHEDGLNRVLGFMSHYL